MTSNNQIENRLFECKTEPGLILNIINPKKHAPFRIIEFNNKLLSLNSEIYGAVAVLPTFEFSSDEDVRKVLLNILYDKPRLFIVYSCKTGGPTLRFGAAAFQCPSPINYVPSYSRIKEPD